MEARDPACPIERLSGRVWVLLRAAERRLPQPSPVGQSLQRHYSHTDHYNDHIGHSEVTWRCERGKGSVVSATLAFDPPSLGGRK